MTRRSPLNPSQRIDLVQRRRTREGTMYSESPIPMNIKGLPGTGDGGGGTVILTPGITDMSWLSSEISWLDSEASWLA